MMSFFTSFLYTTWSKEELWDAKILNLPSLIEEKVNWYLLFGDNWIQNKKIRLEAYDRISQFLSTIQKDSVTLRNDLRPYLFSDYSSESPQVLRSLDSGWKPRYIYSTGNNLRLFNNLRPEYLIDDLRQCGWLPLDPLYEDSDEWRNAKLILTDASIKKALEGLKIPFNRDWCFCLVEDFASL